MLKNRLQVTHNKIIRFVLKMDPRSHVGANEFKSFGWLPVSHRVDQIILNHDFRALVVYWFVLLLLFLNEHVLVFLFPNQFYASRLTMTCNQNLRTAMEIREITFSFLCYPWY